MALKPEPVGSLVQDNWKASLITNLSVPLSSGIGSRKSYVAVSPVLLHLNQMGEGEMARGKQYCCYV